MSDESTTENQPASTNNPADLPDWARKAISEANSEAASYRQKAKTTADEVKAEVTASFTEQLKALSDEKSAITAERNDATSNYARLVAALEAKVPGDSAVEFAALLQGSTPEEYKTHAEKLKSMFGAGGRTRAVDPSAGLTGETATNPGDLFAQLINNKLTPR